MQIRRVLSGLVILGIVLTALPLSPAGATGGLTVALVRMSTAVYTKYEIPARQVLDYGAFVLLEMTPQQVERLERSGLPYQAYAEPFTLRLGGQALDTRAGRPALPAGWDLPRHSGADLYLLQLFGPTQAGWLEQLRQNGLEPVQYIYPFTYVVWGTAQQVAVAAQTPFVRWSAPFAPAYRVLPRWRALRGPQVLNLLLYRGADTDAAVAAVEHLGGRLLGRRVLNKTWEIAGVELAGEKVQAAAGIPGVYSIQPRKTDGGLRGEMSNQINVNNHDQNNQAFPGYLDWLAAAGVDGSGVIIANVDGGIQDTHPDLVNRIVPCTGQTCGGSTMSDHGTHTAGIMAADGSSGVKDDSGFYRGLGMAPGANLVEQVYDPWFQQPGGMLLLMTESYRNDASLSGNSWGPSGFPQGYDDDTMQVDIGVRDADPDAPGNQPLNYILSIMNGNGGYQTQGTPDEAKNIFTIGSTKMQYSSGQQDLNINDLSANTAHGPCLDGRNIPHMVAPGCYVDSANIGGHELMCGTSMASPHVSGAVALFIEYYRNLFGLDPSPAMVKAAFLPVAHDLAGHLDADGNPLGHPFDYKQGWGRMDTAAVVSPTAPIAYFDAPLILDNTGEEWVRTISAADPSKPVRIMLVWTDAPGHGLGGETPAWNNDLDLLVEYGGDSFYGNNFGDDGWSQPGGAADYRNNTEGVFLGPTANGVVTIHVVAADINSDGIPNYGDDTDQDFSLVCWNCVLGADFTLAADPAAFEVCKPETLTSTVEVGEVLTYPYPVALEVGGMPAGVTADLQPTLVMPPGQAWLTLTVGLTTADGLHTIVVTGTAQVTNVHTTEIDLAVSGAAPPAPTLIEPPDGAVDLPNSDLLFRWSRVSGTLRYRLQVDDRPDLGSPEFDVSGILPESYTLAGPLEPGRIYYWRVVPTNGCGDGPAGDPFLFSTRPAACILLVDDDKDDPDVRSYYTGTLEALGLDYEVWDVSTQGNPAAANLMGPSIVLWFTGYPWDNTFNSLNETAVAAYLDAGGNFFLSSEDYLYDLGLTPFGQNYLGISSYQDDVQDTDPVGIPGDPIGDGLGPYTLVPPPGWGNLYTDDVSGIQASPFRWNGSGQDNATRYQGATFRSVFFPWPLEGLASLDDRSAVLERIVDWFGGCTCEPVSQVDLVWQPLTPTVGQEVTFTAVASGDPPFTFTWDLGDGITATGQTVTHTYALSGAYQVTLLAQNCATATASVSYTVVVSETACESVDILTVTTEISGCQVHFEAALAGDAPYRFTWDLGFTQSHAPSPTLDLGGSGTYPYTLTVVNCGGVFSDLYGGQVSVSCEGCRPAENAALSWTPLTPTVGQMVLFSATAEGSPPFTFTWDLGDGITATGVTVTHIYMASASFTVTVMAENGCGSDAAGAVLVVQPCRAPEAGFTSNSPVVLGQAMVFTSVVSGTEPFVYRWDLGDGVGRSDAPHPLYTYTQAGRFTVTLTVTGTCGVDTFADRVEVLPAGVWRMHLPLVFKP